MVLCITHSVTGSIIFSNYVNQLMFYMNLKHSLVQQTTSKKVNTSSGGGGKSLDLKVCVQSGILNNNNNNNYYYYFYDFKYNEIFA